MFNKLLHIDYASELNIIKKSEMIKEIYTIIHKAFENGQPFFRIHIFPFKMTDNNMRKYRKKKWSGFWKNLKEGYDYFKKHKTPPDVSVHNKKYIFN